MRVHPIAMPELPEMETYRRRLEAVMVGRALNSIEAARPKRLNRPAAELVRTMRGYAVSAVRRRGKSLAILLDVPQPLNTLYVHLMLGGRISLSDDEKPGAVILALAGGHQVHFHLGLGRVDAITEAELGNRWAKLGVEPLSPAYRPDIWQEAYANTARPIKTCLMEQKAVAGIGNVYSDEILYRCRLYPGTPAMTLTAADWQHLGRAVPQVLGEAVELGGVGPPMDPEDLVTGRYRRHLAVHYRQGEPCGEGSIVRTERIGGRTSYWCPAVQSPP